MKFLRTVSTRRLLGLIAAVVVTIAGGTAIAVAASGAGPVPKQERLAQAIRGALGAPAVTALSARIQFTNNLINTSQIQAGDHSAGDPLLTGATGRLWMSKNALRLELQSANGDTQIVVNNGKVWAYHPSSNTVYEATLPAQNSSDSASADESKTQTIPSLAQIQTELNKLTQHLGVSGAKPTDVAGRPTYTVSVSPKQSGGLLGGAQLAWDAVRGVPLRFAIYAKGDSTPVIEMKATSISYGQVPRSDFAISPPAGAKVVNISLPSGKHTAKQHAAAKHVQFKLTEPAQLAGLSRSSVKQFGDAALITYGKGLGAIVVLEQRAHPASAAKAKANAQSSSASSSGLSLPTVSINGATAQELPTALGTIVRFSRAGVSYTVLGSQPTATVVAAARGL